MKLECQECGAVGRYAVSNETECRNCGGSDLDLVDGRATLLEHLDPGRVEEIYEHIRSEYRLLRAELQ